MARVNDELIAARAQLVGRLPWHSWILLDVFGWRSYSAFTMATTERLLVPPQALRLSEVG